MPDIELIERHGQGLYGEVWRARDPRLNRPLAVKFFRESAADLAALLDHARALARVNHPNVVTIHTVQPLSGPDGTLEEAVVMEWIDGKTLFDVLRASVLSREEVRSVGIGAIDGLTAIHKSGLAHRDFHAGNVIVSNTGQVKVIDILHLGTAFAHTEQRVDDQQRDLKNLGLLLIQILQHSRELPLDAGNEFLQLIRESDDLAVYRAAFEQVAARRDADSTRLLTAPKPDVRVRIQAVETWGTPLGRKRLLNLVVENHSPVAVYVSGVLLTLREGRVLYPAADAVYGSRPHGITIQPGDSWQFPMDPERINEHLRSPGDLVSVVVNDKIGRSYHSDPTETRSALLQSIHSDRLGPATTPETDPEISMALLDFLSHAWLVEGQRWLQGLDIRLRLGSRFPREQLAHTMALMVPELLVESGHPGSESYSVTAEGLVRSKAGPVASALAEQLLQVIRNGVHTAGAGFKLDSEQLVANGELASDDPNLIAGVLSAFNMIGGGSSSGSPTSKFNYSIPNHVERLLACSDINDLLKLCATLEQRPRMTTWTPDRPQ